MYITGCYRNDRPIPAVNPSAESDTCENIQGNHCDEAGEDADPEGDDDNDIDDCYDIRAVPVHTFIVDGAARRDRPHLAERPADHPDSAVEDGPYGSHAPPTRHVIRQAEPLRPRRRDRARLSCSGVRVRFTARAQQRRWRRTAAAPATSTSSSLTSASRPANVSPVTCCASLRFLRTRSSRTRSKGSTDSRTSSCVKPSRRISRSRAATWALMTTPTLV